jgi:ribosomal protein S18 acetylase RimI-like enzyme
MHPAVTIRHAEFSDVEAIQRVARAAYHAAYTDFLDADALDAQLDEWYSTDSVENRVLRDASTLLVADHDTDGVVGYASGGPTPKSKDADADDPPPTRATLYTCYVHPDHWGERVGHQLLTEIEDRLRDRGFERLEIPVLAANDRARQFYTDHGYPTAYTDTAEFGGETHDEATHAGDL